MLVLLVLDAGQSVVAFLKFLADEIDTLRYVLLAVVERLLHKDWPHDFINLKEMSRPVSPRLGISIHFMIHLVLIFREFIQFLEHALVFIQLTIEKLTLLHHLRVICEMNQNYKHLFSLT